MTKTATVLRNSLIFLALGAASSATVWAAEAAAAVPAPASVPLASVSSTSTPPASTQKFTVPYRSADTPPTPRVLNLKAPDIRAVMTVDELDAALNVPDETDVVEPDTVQVHGAAPAPYVPGGFAALYWGATHPADAWRILAPVQ